jgi:hypothetical protein
MPLGLILIFHLRAKGAIENSPQFQLRDYLDKDHKP